MEEGNGGSVAAFLTKLWSLVEDTNYDDLICWSVSGTSFYIYDQTSFAQNVLPVYFKHRNISSFIRQLNMYGFRKVSSIESGGVKFEHDELEFAHPYFIRGREDLVELIKRKASAGKNEPAASVQKSGEMRMLLQDVQKLHERQEALTTKMDAMKKENSALWKELAVMWQRHNKQQHVVAKLLHFLMGMLGKGPHNALKRSLLAPQSDDEGPSVVKMARPSSLGTTSASQIDDTSISIEDVTDFTDNGVMTTLLLSPNVNVDNMLEGIISPLNTPDARAIWNDHGQLAAPVAVEPGSCAQAAGVSDSQRGSGYRSTRASAKKSTSFSSSTSAQQKSTSAGFSVLKATSNSQATSAKQGAGSSNSSAAKKMPPNRPTVVISKPTSASPNAKRAGTTTTVGQSTTAANANRQLVPAYSRQLFVPPSYSSTNNNNVTRKATSVMQAPGSKASAAEGKTSQGKVKGSVAPVTIVSPGGKVFMRTVRSASPVVAEMSPVTSEISDALDLTQADIETLQDMLANSQVHLNFDALRELCSPEVPLSFSSDLAFPSDPARMTHDDLINSIAGELVEYKPHDDLSSSFSVDDFINHHGIVIDENTNTDAED